jgi:hypothetical protein
MMSYFGDKPGEWLTVGLADELSLPGFIPAPLSSPKSRGLVRRQTVRRKRPGSDNEAFDASSKRPRHEPTTKGIWASSTVPDTNDICESGPSHQLRHPIDEAEGYTAHVCPSERSSDQLIGHNVEFWQASDMAGPNIGHSNEDVWEDVLDGGKVGSSGAMVITDAEPPMRRRSSNTSFECRDNPNHESPNIGEHELLNCFAIGSSEDLAVGCLPSMAVQSPVRAGSGSGQALRTTSPDLVNSPLMEFLQYAHSGAPLGTLDDEHFQAVNMAADFLFSAGLTEDAFVVYHWIYESLNSAPHATPELLFSAVIDLARSSATASQDRMCRVILLQTLHNRAARKERGSQETFLLHAFLTMIFRRQEDFPRADFHCHRALTCFLSPEKQSIRSKNAWHSLVWAALDLLEASLTEQRLSQFHRELDVESRQRVLGRASDHLINASRPLWSGDILNPGASRPVKTVSRLETVIEEAAEPTSVLKKLLYWCAQALERAKVIRSLRQSWRKTRKSGTKLRDVSRTTLYCILHQQWREENAAATLANSPSASWTSRVKSEFDLMPSECLAAVPEMLALTWPYADEDMPLLSNWRTCLFELQKRAVREIAKLLKEPDVTVAHLFFQASSFQCIPSARRADTDSGPRRALRTHILQICSTRFGTLIPSESQEDRFELDAMDFQRGLDPRDRLPSLAPSRDNSLLSHSHLSLTRRTSMHSHPSSRSKGSHRSVRLPLRSRSDASMNSNSSGLASMESLSKRISHTLESREQQPSEPPSAAVRDMIDEDMDLENLMGTARRSFEALSWDPESGDLVTEPQF